MDFNYRTYLFIILITHFVVSLFFAQNYLNNEISYGYYFGLKQGDYGWIGPAFILGYENDLIRSVGSAFRLPGYIIFQGFFMKLFESPVLVLKIVQIALSSMLIPIVFLISKNISNSNQIGLISSLLIALWFPLHAYALDLTGVTFSIFIYSLFVWSLFALSKNMQNKNKFLFLIGVFLGLLALAKSNHILIFFSLFIALCYFNKNILIALKDCLKSGFVAGIIILPWTFFISSHNNTFIFPSVVGPQALVSYSGIKMQPPDSLMGKVIGKYDLYSDEKYKKFRSVYMLKPNPCIDKILEYLLNDRNPYLDPKFSIAESECYDWKDYSKLIKKSSADVMEVYYNHVRENTIGVVVYGFSKIAHAFGFSLRGFSDYISLLFFISSFSSSIYLWRNNLYRGFVVFYWGSLTSFSLNAFILMGYVRYRVIFFDLTATILIGLMLSSLILKKTLDTKT